MIENNTEAFRSIRELLEEAQYNDIIIKEQTIGDNDYYEDEDLYGSITTKKEDLEYEFLSQCK